MLRPNYSQIQYLLQSLPRWSVSALQSVKRSGNNIAFLSYTVFTLYPVGSLSQRVSVSHNIHKKKYTHTLLQIKLKSCSPQTEPLDLRRSSCRHHRSPRSVSSVIRTDQVHPTGQEAVEVVRVGRFRLIFHRSRSSKAKLKRIWKQMSEGLHRARPWLANRGL